MLTASCGRMNTSLSGMVSSEENPPKTSSKNTLLVSGGLIVGGIAASCLLVVKVQKVCRGFFRQRGEAEHRASEAVAATKQLKQELNYIKQELGHSKVSFDRLYKKHLELEKQTSVYLGRQANINGMLLEYVSIKEIPLILQKRGIYVLETLQSVKGRYRDAGKKVVHFELDAMFLTKDSVYFLEAKTHLHKGHADKFANHIAHMKQANFDHLQINARLKRKEIKGIMTYVFDSSMPEMTRQQGKSASSYAQKTHGIATFRIHNWREFKNKDVNNIPKTAFAL